MRTENLIKEQITEIGTEQKVYKFDNGYGASVIRDGYTYGGRDGLWELAVIKFDGEEYSLTYETDITDDVIGYLTEDSVDTLLNKIEALNADGNEIYYEK